MAVTRPSDSFDACELASEGLRTSDATTARRTRATVACFSGDDRTTRRERDRGSFRKCACVATANPRTDTNHHRDGSRSYIT